MSTRYVCANGCGGHAYTRGVYRCPTCGHRLRFLERESHPDGCRCVPCKREESADT